jgi:hypothetical protein
VEEDARAVELDGLDRVEVRQVVAEAALHGDVVADRVDLVGTADQVGGKHLADDQDRIRVVVHQFSSVSPAA